MYEIFHYLTVDGSDVFDLWLDSLIDPTAVARIVVRTDRLQAGNFGGHKPVGSGVWELRIDHGPGYRVYYPLAGHRIVLLLCGGDKRKQSSDIRRAVTMWEDYKKTGWQTMKRKTPDPLRDSHDDKVVERLKKDPLFASEYLRAAMDDADEPRVLLIALRRIAEARGGITRVARKAGVERDSLRRALSGRGNPRFSTLSAVAKAV